MINKSILFLKITRDVALSKNPPSPKLNFDGGQDLTNRFTHPNPFIRCRDLSNSTDLTNGTPISLKGHTIMTDMLSATAENNTKIVKGTSDVEEIIMYNEKLTNMDTPPTRQAMRGGRNTELCMADSICRVRNVPR